MRRHMQVVFQDPFTSLNPRCSVRQILTGPMHTHGLGNSREERDYEATRLLDLVGLSSEALLKRPHQFSGGERQRIAIARALVLQPELLICDEAVSALDMSVQVQVLDLLRDLQDRLNLAYLFISHDLFAVRYLADHVMVMYEGHAVEQGPASSVYAAPSHHYTRQLLAHTSLHRDASPSMCDGLESQNSQVSWHRSQAGRGESEGQTPQ